MRDIDDKHKGQHMGVWARNLAKIDAKIESYASQIGEELNEKANFEELENEIRDWFDKQELDEDARREWNRLKLDARLFKAKVENRLNELAERGKIKFKQWTAGGGSN